MCGHDGLWQQHSHSLAEKTFEGHMDFLHCDSESTIPPLLEVKTHKIKWDVLMKSHFDLDNILLMTNVA